jgi:hypothetical protein
VNVTPHEELRSLMQRYARAADERDVDALAALFHSDATVQGARGAQTIDEWLDAMRGPRAFPVSMHFLGDPLIELESDNEGLVDTYAVVYQVGDRDAGQPDLTLGIRYLDEVVREDGTWMIRRRTARNLWMR